MYVYVMYMLLSIYIADIHIFKNYIILSIFIYLFLTGYFTFAEYTVKLHSNVIILQRFKQTNQYHFQG